MDSRANGPLSIVHTESSCGWGGQEIRILTEAQGFLARGHRVQLLAPPEAPIVPAAQRMKLAVVCVPLARKGLPGLVALRRWIVANRAQIDLINTHSSTDTWLAAVACATLGGAPPIVRTRHLSSHVINRVGTQWLYRRASAHIVTTGEAIRRQLARDNHVPLARMTSIPTGIDLARFVPGDPHRARKHLQLPDRPTLGIVATMRAWKGHVYLFDALARQRDAWRDWQVLVVGGGPDRLPLEADVVKRGLSDLVRFTGHQDDVVPWMQSLDMLVLPSYSDEGVPQAIMQAMACSVPVVSTRVGGIPEAVDEGVTGLLIEPRSAPALAAGLSALRDDPALRVRFGRAARERAMRDFGIDRMLDRMETVFRSILRR